MKERIAAIRHELGGVFEDEENTYCSFGKDWWTLAFLPSYPKRSDKDMIVTGIPHCHSFTLENTPEPGGCRIRYNFHTFGDLCFHISATRHLHDGL